MEQYFYYQKNNIIMGNRSKYAGLVEQSKQYQESLLFLQTKLINKVINANKALKLSITPKNV